MKSIKSGDKIDFGKYTGKTFDHVCQFDPEYLQWMWESRICDDATYNRYGRGEFIRKEFANSEATVFIWG